MWWVATQIHRAKQRICAKCTFFLFLSPARIPCGTNSKHIFIFQSAVRLDTWISEWRWRKQRHFFVNRIEEKCIYIVCKECTCFDDMLSAHCWRCVCVFSGTRMCAVKLQKSQREKKKICHINSQDVYAICGGGWQQQCRIFPHQIIHIFSFVRCMQMLAVWNWVTTTES